MTISPMEKFRRVWLEPIRQIFDTGISLFLLFGSSYYAAKEQWPAAIWCVLWVLLIHVYEISKKLDGRK